MAAKNGVVSAGNHVVVVSRSQSDEFLIKVVTVDDQCAGIKQIRPKSLLDMLKAAAGQVSPAEEEPRAPASGGPPNLFRSSSVLVGSKNTALVVNPSELKPVGENGVN